MNLEVAVVDEISEGIDDFAFRCLVTAAVNFDLVIVRAFVADLATVGPELGIQNKERLPGKKFGERH